MEPIGRFSLCCGFPRLWPIERDRALTRLIRYCSILALTLACLAAVAPAARANIVAVSTSPGTAQVAIPNGSAITINWRAQRANTVRPTNQTIISTSGTIAIGGTTVATISTTVSKANATPAGTSTTETITETLLVPRNVAFQIAKNPGLAVTYTRSFDDGSGATSSGQITLIPSGPSSAELGIRRLDLSFQDRSRVQILPEGNELFAFAEINFDGAGVAQLEWQIAEPSSTRGGLIFRRLQIVRRSFAGRARVTLKSPPLPTQTQGLYIIRLAVTNPTLTFDTPDLKYFVVPRKGATSAPAGQRIGLLAPVENAPLTAETEFAWQDVPGAAVYQLEVYSPRSIGAVGPADTESIGGTLLVDPDELARRPIAGIALPAADTTVSLKTFSLARLEAGRAYLWRVKAIAGNGAVIGTSSLRRITVPR